MSEIEWRDIPGLPKYQVSRCGKVQSFIKWRREPVPRLLKPGTLERRKYIYIKLPSGKMKHLWVHRLVMLAFVGPSELTVNHIDGNPSNNHLSNLEYVTIGQNLKHAYETGLKGVGENHPCAKLSTKQVREIYHMEGSSRKIAAKYGISQTTVLGIKNRKSRTYEAV